MVRGVATFAFVLSSLAAFAREPGCGGEDHPENGPNAPCTRSNDCKGALQCSEGVCREPDAGTPKIDAG